MNHTQQPAILAPDRVDTDPIDADLTPADLLDGAALYIERHGLHQGEMYADWSQLTPAACLQGALWMSASGGTAVTCTPGIAALVEETMAVLAEYLCGLDYPLVHANPGDCIADWNDTPGRTAAHAAAALRTAARQWQHTHGGAQ